MTLQDYLGTFAAGTEAEPTTSASDSQFKEFRVDGWPLCPICGEDELGSRVMLFWNGKEPRPTLQDCLAGSFFCYYCDWTNTK